MRVLVSGGAPLRAETARFFEGIGVRMLEGYGLTEFPVISVNRPDRWRIGSVGAALPDIEVRIAEDGEILARGPSLMRGYFGHPASTAEAIDPEGWFHTGDIGSLSPEGFIHITDRKKDIIVLANGKNVAPQPIEGKLKESPFISEVVLIGDKRNALVALVVPAMDRLKEWGAAQGLPIEAIPEFVERVEVRRLIKQEIAGRSETLADFERVKRFAVMPAPFTIEGGELTPTLKVRRRAVAAKYADVIERITGEQA